MLSQYGFFTGYDEEPLLKRLAYYALLFLIGYTPGLLTGYLLWH